MAIFHSYCDESGKQGDSPFPTFSALCLPCLNLQAFDKDWEQELRIIGKPYLHMAKASRLSQNYGNIPRNQTAKERIAALSPFAECIKKHFEVGVMMAMETKAFKVLTPTARQALGKISDPYHLSFMRGTLHLVRYIQPDDRLSMICDDDLETALDCYGYYRQVRHSWPEAQQKLISLSFSDDKYFPALQAADMLAFLFRCEARRMLYRDSHQWVNLFNTLVTTTGTNITWFHTVMDEQKVKRLSNAIDELPEERRTPRRVG